MNKLVKLSATAGVVGFMLFSHNVLAAEVEKQDNQIVVNEPTVEYSTESAETYVNKDLVYKTEIPDDIEINSGDQLRYTLPEELNWTTRQEFDVTNPDGEVVGNAVASNETRDVVTTSKVILLTSHLRCVCQQCGVRKLSKRDRSITSTSKELL